MIIYPQEKGEIVWSELGSASTTILKQMIVYGNYTYIWLPPSNRSFFSIKAWGPYAQAWTHVVNTKLHTNAYMATSIIYIIHKSAFGGKINETSL
jgi:hypothetical protein